jgi:hypothetical protein
MKCNLAQVWKRTTEDLLRKRNHEKTKAEKLAFYEAQQKLIRSLKTRGWEFRSEGGYHPHKGDAWSTEYFKSPRMWAMAVLNDDHDIIRREAFCYAKEVYEGLKVEYTQRITDILWKHFEENPDSTTPPEIIIFRNLTNAVPSHQQ